MDNTEIMPIHDFNAERLYVDAPLGAGKAVECTSEQAHYLLNVLRLNSNDSILIFNGRDGEWRATLRDTAKRRCRLIVEEQTRAQEGGPDLAYLFAPLKRSRLDYMVQKATEMGAARLQPVFTRRTIAGRVNLDRMRANAKEAAEQCGILGVPEVAEPVPLARLLESWDKARRIIFCDEAAVVTDPLACLGTLAPGPFALLVGPEGGFAPNEREALLSYDFTTAISLGPRIMRADTAAVAALALLNAVHGDWKDTDR
jgi:16S rRNA (uracil1498-N3)-methyltransferase